MIKTTVMIDGMACGMCEAHINDAIRAKFNVKKVKSSHKKKLSEIISEDSLNEDDIKQTITAAGYTVVSVASQPYTKKFFL